MDMGKFQKGDVVKRIRTLISGFLIQISVTTITL